MPTFNPDYFSPLAKHNFQKILPEVFDFTKNANYLEIGSFQGASTHFMFNSLLNGNSKATVIDPFENSKSEAIGNFEIFKNNLGEYLDRIDICKDFSTNVLKNLEKESYDIAYIDGSHLADDVYFDMENVMPLMKSGGIIICDDYLWWLLGGGKKYYKPFEYSQPMKAINKFIKERRDEIEDITKPSLLEFDESDCDISFTEDEVKSLLYDNLDKLTKNGVNEYNYQYIFRKK